MALFVARHEHPADRCPATDPNMGPMLLQHLSPEGASKNGITIQGEAVVNGAHTLYLIMEGPSREQVEQYLAPFAQAGSVEIFNASPCADVIKVGGCGMVGLTA